MDAVLEAEGIVKRYKGQTVLDGVSLEVGRGEAVGLVGPNGAGKTTLIKVSLGLARRDAGRVLLNGLDPWREPGAREGVGVVFERPNLPSSMPVVEFLESAAAVYGSSPSRVDWAIRAVGLEGHEWKAFSELSAGLKQRAAIAHALLGEPRFLVADEPTSNLDPLERREVLRLLARLNREHGLSLLVSSHVIVELLRVATRIYVLTAGRLAARGRPEELFRRARLARLRTSDPSRAAALLRSLGFSAVEDGLGVLVRVEEPLPGFYQALAHLARQGVEVLGVDLVEPGVEEAMAG
ncbi:ABC transporter ATP-binding protein [Aeropyrum camini]|uniref:ABC-type multidrug transporter n=1 Tax=Aeropyrum camini SY1 = JCM 12091 TaxID=1198449 RepID=U3TE26_9CREN|nr:ABC transporter ATP-binding protein [Aeropyrum camini]BAN90671.1 ABC-type multidrug transporter [Aeropyrum camini SY1 = JCM 12091]